MQFTFDHLGAYKRGRLWLDESPLLPYSSQSTVEKTFIQKNGLQSSPCRLTIELVLRAGMISKYAFIGVTYSPSNEGKLVVKAEVGHENGTIIEDIIALKPDEVRLGIPEEYITAIVDEIHKLVSDANDLLPSGTLIIHTGAHGLVGSSQMSFRKAIRVVLNLLTHGDLNNGTEIRDLITKELNIPF
ncbi:hypothetical protein [Paenibacillus kobensis]|uniref:hypothetical protein n=1 Tax=Paenibacillus kobensis TaxID=59841 RepID=UPI000FD8DE51|nr:hypothetical protein [Paenibacillus kobensis]